MQSKTEAKNAVALEIQAAQYRVSRLVALRLFSLISLAMIATFTLLLNDHERLEWEQSDEARLGSEDVTDGKL